MPERQRYEPRAGLHRQPGRVSDRGPRLLRRCDLAPYLLRSGPAGGVCRGLRPASWESWAPYNSRLGAPLTSFLDTAVVRFPLFLALFGYPARPALSWQSVCSCPARRPLWNSTSESNGETLAGHGRRTFHARRRLQSTRRQYRRPTSMRRRTQQPVDWRRRPRSRSPLLRSSSASRSSPSWLNRTDGLDSRHFRPGC